MFQIVAGAILMTLFFVVLIVYVGIIIVYALIVLGIIAFCWLVGYAVFRFMVFMSWVT